MLQERNETHRRSYLSPPPLSRPPTLPVLFSIFRARKPFFRFFSSDHRLSLRNGVFPTVPPLPFSSFSSSSSSSTSLHPLPESDPAATCRQPSREFCKTFHASLAASATFPPSKQRILVWIEFLMEPTPPGAHTLRPRPLAWRVVAPPFSHSRIFSFAREPRDAKASAPVSISSGERDTRATNDVAREKSISRIALPRFELMSRIYSRTEMCVCARDSSSLRRKFYRIFYSFLAFNINCTNARAHPDEIVKRTPRYTRILIR